MSTRGFIRTLFAPLAISLVSLTIPTSVSAAAPATSAPKIGAGITYAPGNPNHRAAVPGGTGSNMSFHGGQVPFNTGVLASPHLYLSFWGSAWNSDPKLSQLVDFATNLGGSSWTQILTQYCGVGTAPLCAGGGVQNLPGQFKGSYVDTASEPSPGFSDTPGSTGGPISGSGGAVERAIAHFGGLDVNANYVILTPNNQNPSWFGATNMCAYHSAIQFPAGAASMATFSVVPYVSALPGCAGSGAVNGALDGFTDAIAHEYAEAVTNPDAVCGWSEGTGTCPGTVTHAASGGEIADKCAGIPAGSVTLGSKAYALPYLWSNKDGGCSLGAAPAAGPPAAPSGVVAVAGNGSATVSWAAPSSSTPITGYKVTTSPAVAGSPFTEPALTTAVITGLSNGTPYTFTVIATNAAGDSQASPPSAAITPSAPQTFPGGGYTSVNPYRVLDTRSGARLGPAATTTVQIAGTGGPNGVPASATGVVLNVTAVTPTAAGYLTVWPAGVIRPTASNLNFVPGQVVPNLVEVALSSGGAISIFNSGGSTDVIADVAGYTSSAGDGFNPLTPTRLEDTRNDGKTLGSAGSLIVTLPSSASGATGAIFNVTVTNTTGNGYLTVYPTGSTQPLASNLNFTAGQTVPNRVQVKVGTNNSITIFNSSGSSDVIVDINGYFAPGGGALFTGVTPTRLEDTRSDAMTIGSSGTLGLTVAGGASPAGVPAGARAVVLNVTVAGPSGSGYLTVAPGLSGHPTSSDLNFGPGQVVPNLVVVAVSGRGINIFNSAGSTDVIVDIAGWYS